MTKAQELSAQLEAKQVELQSILSGAKLPDGTYKLDGPMREDVKARNDEMTEIGKKRDEARDQEQFVELERKNAGEIEEFNRQRLPGSYPGSPGKDADRERELKSLGDRVVESAEYKQFGGQKGAVYSITLDDIDVKTLMSTAAGIAPADARGPVVVLSAQRRPVVSDLVPQDPTTEKRILYLEETTFTNAAAATAEGATKPEGAVQFTERSANVEKIAVTLPVTDEQLEDVAAARGIVNNRLTLMVGLSEEVELLNGSGTTPHVRGFYNATSLQNVNKGSDPVPDAIYKAMQLVRTVGRAEPSGLVIHPDDWTGIRLLRTADGIYIWGSPAEAGPERIWGLPAVQTTAATATLPLTGDFAMYSHISRRKGLVIEVGYNNDDFGRNRRTFRAEERLSLEVYRGTAFATANLAA